MRFETPAAAFAALGVVVPQMTDASPIERRGVIDIAKGVLGSAIDAGMQIAKCAKECVPVTVLNDYMGDDDGRIECWDCLHGLQLGQRLPISYTMDIASMKGGDTQAICGHDAKHLAKYPDEGVDITIHPTGWRKEVSGDGEEKWVGCERKSDFPGINSTVIVSHAEVKRLLEELPAKTNDHTVWRGNELGYFITDNVVWENVSPHTIALGASPEQHKITRKILDELYSKCDEKCQTELDRRAKETFAHHLEKGKLAIYPVADKFVRDTIFWRTFGDDVKNPLDDARMAALKLNWGRIPQMTQLVPTAAARILLRNVRDELKDVLAVLRPLVAHKFGAALEDKDCTPTGSCIDQMTSLVLDTLLLAGGASVPAAIRSAVWVLHATDTKDPEIYPVNYELDKENIIPFMLEVMRMMPPVRAIPYWTKPPQVASHPTEYDNQYEGGIRVSLSIGLAGKDPNVWGEDAHKFRVRPLAEYKEKYMGFGEPARDDSVEGGAQDRHCPGKYLSYAIFKAWFSNWDQYKWSAQDDMSTFIDTPPYVQNYVLKKDQSYAALEALRDTNLMN